MFKINHDKTFVYSLIQVRDLTRPILQREEPIESLMFLWANKTAIPHIECLETWWKNQGHGLDDDGDPNWDEEMEHTR